MLFVVIYKEIGKTRKITNWFSILIPKRNKNLSVYEKKIESKKNIDNFLYQLTSFFPTPQFHMHVFTFDTICLLQEEKEIFSGYTHCILDTK